MYAPVHLGKEKNKNFKSMIYKKESKLYPKEELRKNKHKSRNQWNRKSATVCSLTRSKTNHKNKKRKQNNNINNGKGDIATDPTDNKQIINITNNYMPITLAS